MTSLLIDLLDGIAAAPHADPRLRGAVSEIRHVLEPVESNAPFLSVIVRTQGKRLESLKDALLCLAAQSCQDFEVIVTDHDAGRDDAIDVRRVIDEQPRNFRDRIRVIEVSGGTRSKPLNAGVLASRGRYVAVFDDDDILFANWVEEFEAASRTTGGRLLRAQVGIQEASPTTWPHGEIGFWTASSISAPYPHVYDQLRHVRVNASPFMGWAFPAVLFRGLGYRFDEELEVCEDWDVILRGAALLGVTDVHALTAVYRRWENGESSYDVHDLGAWSASESRVIEKLDSAPLLFDRGAATQLREVLVYEDSDAALVALLAGTTWKLARPIRLAVRIAVVARPVVGRFLRKVHLR